MTNDIRPILKRLEIEDTGRYENHFYIVTLEDSNDYARMYTKLDKNANNPPDTMSPAPRLMTASSISFPHIQFLLLSRVIFYERCLNIILI